MKIPRLHQDRRRVLQIEMTPMVDVVFLLLVFFLWTSSFRRTEYDLPGEIAPDADTSGAAATRPPPAVDLEPLVVRIALVDGRPNWRINGRPYADLASLADALQAVAEVNLKLPLIVDPDDGVPLGDAIDVYDLGRRLGWPAVRFATHRPWAAGT